MYSRQSGTRLQTDDGKDRIRIEGITIVAPAEMPSLDALEVGNRLKVDFDDNISLIGYDLTPPILKAGESVQLTFLWMPRGAVGKDYTVFNHLLDSRGAMVAQKDGRPADGFYPTGRWKTGELVRDRYEIAIPDGTPPGIYHLAIGLYSGEDGGRLRISSAGARLPQRLNSLLGWLMGSEETVEADRILLRPLVVEQPQ